MSEYSIEELNQEKTEAAKVEDYAKAAIYKKAADLKTQLDEAVVAEDYDSAANLKAELDKTISASAYYSRLYEDPMGPSQDNSDEMLRS